MRAKQEIKQTVDILCRKTDRLSKVMAEVLQGRMTEQQVFQKYVMEVMEANRDEAVFFAARDAARYLAGHIDMDMLVSDIESQSIEKPVEPVYISIPQTELRRMQNTLRRLEEKLNMLCDIKSKETVREDELMTKKEAVKYLGCSESTIEKWTKLGLVKTHCVKVRLYYIKSELDASPVVQQFLKSKKEE